MNGQESTTSPVSREDFRTYRTTTRLVSDTIADTAHLSLRLAERLLRNGTVDVSPSGTFTVRLELEEADLPAFQNAIQLRADLGETIDDRFRALEHVEDDFDDRSPDHATFPTLPLAPEPFETFTTLGEAAAPVFLRAALARMRSEDFAEAANGRTFQMSRLVVAALTRTAPGSFRDISNFVRDKDASATDEEIEDAAMRTMGLRSVR